MKNVCHKYVPKNEEIQFVKIDVEGGERDVLLEYDFEIIGQKYFVFNLQNQDQKYPAMNYGKKYY